MTNCTMETETALAKLARVLGVDTLEIEFLAELDIAELRDLRWQIDDRRHAVDAKRLSSVIAASKMVPPALAANIGEKWFGPVLCARLVGLIEPKRGAQYVRHLNVEFMADITARTDPRVVGDLVVELSLPDMQAIATTLLERGDHLTLSHFVGYLLPQVVVDILGAIDDNAAVVRIARYVEDLASLSPVVALLPDDRLVALVSAIDREDLWPSALHLFSQLSPDQVARVGRVVVALGDEVVRAIIEAFHRHDLGNQGINFIGQLEPSAVASFAHVLLVLDESTMTSAVDAIDAHHAWDILVPVAVAAVDLSAEMRARLRDVLNGVPDIQRAAFENMAQELGHPELLATILRCS
jgi:hypothetical protein